MSNNNYNILIYSPTGQLYGIEKYWAFLKYYKNATNLAVDERLREHLAKFTTIEDFRVLEPQINEMLQGVGKLRNSPDKRRIRSISESEGVATAAPRSISGGSGHGSNHIRFDNNRNDNHGAKYRKRWVLNIFSENHNFFI